VAGVLWACWDGGGNLPPSLGIADELRGRGHEVAFHGREEMVARVATAGHRAHALATARSEIDRFAFLPLPTVFGYTASPAVGDELVRVVARERPDVVVIDAMFAAALDRAPHFGVPTVVMVHTFARRLGDGWRANLEMQSQARVRAGFDPLPGLDVLWGERDAVHVNTLAALDAGPELVPGLVHGAPVLAVDHRAAPVELPWAPDDPTPVVLLSFSTVPEQRDVDALQRALDALAGLPVHVVGTTAGIVSVDELSPAPNTHLVEFADHDQLLGRTTVMVGHGGHGTTMRALRAGVPLVTMPARGADQAGIAAFVESSGLGRALATGSDADAIRDAVETVLGAPAYGEAARTVAALFDGMDGAAFAADTVESALHG
jgi:UDP:flavonoid glycosyltransferase YjiC (YdhE family)